MVSRARSAAILCGASIVMTVACAGTDSTFEDTAALPQVRTYFIAADEVEWDYAPLGLNNITGQPFDDDAKVFVANGPDRIGSKYIKALYREYTDGTFSKLKPRPKSQEHLGVLGPLVRASVGDTIHFVFRNNTTRPLSVHAHGVFYHKANEGAPYNDRTSGGAKNDDAVPPGTTYTYKWAVPERSGPGPADGTSVFWMYHSHTDEVRDSYAGLIGPMIVTARGKARADGSPIDVDRELITMFFVSDENQSPYLAQNIAKYPTDPGSVNPDDEGFVESNLMHSINGYVYGNLPGLDMKKGQMVRWYLMGMGTEVDLHTPHWHGNTLLINGARTDVTGLLPASMMMGDMVPDNVGTWLYHCHVNDHILAGMLALYRVSK
jgi:hephaestin